MIIMRTTVSIDDALLERAKQRALRNNMTLGSFVEDALRAKLAELEQRTAAVSLPTFGSGGFIAGVDPSSNRSLYEALDRASNHDASLHA